MKKISLLFLTLLSVFSLASCNENKNVETKVDPIIVPTEKRIVKDIAGREVKLPEQISRVACIGAGSLRLYSYIADVKYICAVEKVENYDYINAQRTPFRPYYEKNKEYFHTLPVCGEGGRAEKQPNEELLLAAHPDIIFSNHDQEAIEALTSRTNIPVLTVTYRTNDITDPNLTKSLKLIGEVMQVEKKSTALINYLNDSIKSLNDLTKDIPDSEKNSIYYGCNSHSGQRGIQSTVAGYSTFDICNIKNVIDSLEPEGFKKPTFYHEFSLEQLLVLNPDKVIIDGGGIELLKTDFTDPNKKAILTNLDAFKKGEVYVQLPCNAYSTNIEMALINCYYCLSVAYPDLMSEASVKDKVKEITLKFLDVDFSALISERVPDSLAKLDLSKIY